MNRRNASGSLRIGDGHRSLPERLSSSEALQVGNMFFPCDIRMSFVPKLHDIRMRAVASENIGTFCLANHAGRIVYHRAESVLILNLDWTDMYSASDFDL